MLYILQSNWMGMNVDEQVQQTQIAQPIQTAQQIQGDQEIHTLILTWSCHTKKATVRNIVCEVLYYTRANGDTEYCHSSV